MDLIGMGKCIIVFDGDSVEDKDLRAIMAVFSKHGSTVIISKKMEAKVRRTVGDTKVLHKRLPEGWGVI